MGRVSLSMLMGGMAAAQAALAEVGRKKGEEELTPTMRLVFMGVSVGLVLMAGLMSGE